MINLRDYENVQTTQELWKAGEQKFKKWIIIALASMAVLALLGITQVIVSLVLKNQIYEFWNSRLSNGITFNDFISKVWTTSYVVLPSVFVAISIWGIYTLTMSTRASYKAKSFEKLSQTQNYIYGIWSLIVFIQVIKKLFTRDVPSEFEDTLFIPQSIANISSIVISLFVLKQVSTIRLLFVRIKLLENLNKAMGEMGKTNNSPFVPNQNNQPTQDKTQDSQDAQIVQDNTISPEIKSMQSQLEKLDNNRLYAMAEKLNIYGYKDLQRDELINKIIENTTK